MDYKLVHEIRTPRKVKEHDNDDVTIKGKVVKHGKEVGIGDFDLPYENAANALMSAKGYSEYVKKHGYHFTDKLADHVTALMENANGEKHNWTTEQVKKAIAGLGLASNSKQVNETTDGDIAYLANMYYADLFPDPIKDEAGCLKAAYKAASDPDGYKGMIFCRWTADAIGKAISIDWEKFV